MWYWVRNITDGGWSHSDFWRNVRQSDLLGIEYYRDIDLFIS